MEKIGYSVDALLVAAKKRLEQVSNSAEESSRPFVRSLDQNQTALSTHQMTREKSMSLRKRC
jgi:hypothetical protein